MILKTIYEKSIRKIKCSKISINYCCAFLAVFQSNGQQSKPAESGYVPVNGIKVYYEVYGEGRPIVLLHGAFYTIQMNWGELIPALSKTRKVIAIELQGHGHTPYSARKMDFPTFASDVEGVMDHLKIDSADVAGYSMGGSVAYEFAIQYPKRVRKLVIISSTYKSTGWLPVVTNRFKSFKPEFFTNSLVSNGIRCSSAWTRQIGQSSWNR